MGKARKPTAKGPARLVERKIRVTSGTLERVSDYIASRDGKPEADAWRDIIYAGLNVLQPRQPAVAGSIGLAPLTKAA